jgi:hypothetical protein
MVKTNLESHLIEGFLRLNRFLQAEKFRYCLIGGIAAGYWGEPRFTQDMDFTIVSRDGSLGSLEKILKKAGYRIQNKGASQIQVKGQQDLDFQADFILAEMDYQDWVVQRAIPISIFDIEVPIATPEDLIILKLIANRRRDLLDIEGILKRCLLTLDTKYLREWIEYWELGERMLQEFPEAHREIFLG